jgi:hypothetical protein
MGATRVFPVLPALKVFLLFALIGQGAIVPSSALLLASPQSVAPGVHCPLMYHPPQAKPVTSHCPTHETAESRRAEWRCACRAQSPTTPPDTTLTRFLLPFLVELPVPPSGVLEPGGSPTFYLVPFVSPPDPPPRSLLSRLASSHPFV